jgi:hypothetical protein
MEKRFSRGFSFLTSYVFSKSLDNYLLAGPGLAAGNADPFNLRLDFGRGDHDRTHVFTASELWRPEHKFGNTLLRHVLSDWSVGAFETAQSGVPIAFGLSSDIRLDGTNNASKEHAQLQPNMTYDNVGIDHPNTNAFVNSYFNTAAFVPLTQMPLGTLGNAGRNFMNGPALFNVDLTLSREFRLRERLTFQLRGEFFNLFNEKHFQAPNSIVGSGSFGRITGADPGRVVQLAAKLIW